jgi:hypothetical protein
MWCCCLLFFLPAAGEDLAVINGVCHTANSIFKRYRNQFSSDKLVAELAASQVGQQGASGIRPLQLQAGVPE